jgi:RHS repeat-associated protein
MNQTSNNTSLNPQEANLFGKTGIGLESSLVDPFEYTVEYDGEYGELGTALQEYLDNSLSCAEIGPENVSRDIDLDVIEEHRHTPADEEERDIYFYHTDHLGSSSWITYTDGSVTQHMQNLPFGEPFIDQRATSYDIRYIPIAIGITGKEMDSETGYQYFGARYYNSDISVWLSVDPHADKYPSMSSYMYTAGNPVMLVDPDGRYFVGIFGQKTKVRKNNKGKIKVGLLASFAVRKMARRINNSNSETSKEFFLKAANNQTKIHLKCKRNPVNNRLLGLHQAHDENGKRLNWVGDGQGKFDGVPAYIKDDYGNIFYKEVTITIFDGNIKYFYEHNKELADIYKFNYEFDYKDLSVSTITHEIDHNINSKTINAIRDRQEGKANGLDVEKSAESIENKVLKEILENKKQIK